MDDFSEIRALSFDCYGTIIDWETGITESLQPILKSHNINITDLTLLESYAAIESEIEKEPYRPYAEVLREVVRRFGTCYSFDPTTEETTRMADSIANWHPFDDSVEALNKLKKKYQLIILSNIDKSLFKLSERQLPIDFDLVVTAEETRTYKPSPEHFELLLEKTNFATNQILHVAQSLFHDVAPAKRLGIKTVWVNRRHDKTGFGATPISDTKPDYEVKDLLSLATMLCDR